MASPSEPSSPRLLTTPLHAIHRGLNARMVDFAGWDMPLQYPTGILAEHQSVRTGRGLFDLSHMGRVYLRGSDAVALAQECCTRDLSRIPSGEAAYSLLCDPEGGILDDVIAYLLDEREVLFVFNASNRVSDTEWFAAQRDRLGLDVRLEDRTLETALIGVQGPDAEELLSAYCAAPLHLVPGYAFIRTEVAGAPAVVSRTGYTGEDGFEVMVEADAASAVWSRLVAGACPCGLGARDTLRLEAAMPLYGHELSEEIDPLRAEIAVARYLPVVSVKGTNGTSWPRCSSASSMAPIAPSRSTSCTSPIVPKRRIFPASSPWPPERTTRWCSRSRFSNAETSTSSGG